MMRGPWTEYSDIPAQGRQERVKLSSIQKKFTIDNVGWKSASHCSLRSYNTLKWINIFL